MEGPGAGLGPGGLSRGEEENSCQDSEQQQLGHERVSAFESGLGGDWWSGASTRAGSSELGAAFPRRTCDTPASQKTPPGSGSHLNQSSALRHSNSINMENDHSSCCRFHPFIPSSRIHPTSVTFVGLRPQSLIGSRAPGWVPECQERRSSSRRNVPVCITVRLRLALHLRP